MGRVARIAQYKPGAPESRRRGGLDITLGTFLLVLALCLGKAAIDARTLSWQIVLIVGLIVAVAFGVVGAAFVVSGAVPYMGGRSTRVQLPDEQSVSRGWETIAEEGVLRGLTRLLPSESREQFVAEQLGNLGDCRLRWHRFGWLAGIAIATPRLAWIMHHDNRRDWA